MIDARFRYFDDPNPEKPRTRMPSFKSTYARTLERLEYELRTVGAYNIVILAGFANHSIRNDGWPKSGAAVMHPAVELHVNDTLGKALSFPSDAYESYHQNLHAIMLTLDALRAVARHGVGHGGEQYTGWAQIAAPGESSSVASSVESLLLSAGYTDSQLPMQRDQLLTDPLFYKAVLREAKKRTHPDSNGGSRYRFDEVLKAEQQLDVHHKAVTK